MRERGAFKMGSDARINLPWPEWEIVKELGHGGYGKVYQAERKLSGTSENHDVEQAAVKVISFPRSQDDIESDLTDGYDLESIRNKYAEKLQSYINEYKLMMSLKGQTNIVNCDDFATIPHADGIGWDVFIRMELLTPLTTVMKRRRLSESEIIKVGKDVCRALTLCERANIVHRDVKPENIMVSKFGDYKLGDFGIAKTMDHTTNATMIGTERYMAPEVIKREPYGREVDIYSLGLVLYWMLNNRKIPFIDADELPGADKLNEAQNRRVRGEKLPPPKYGSRSLKKVVLKACEYRPENRYAAADLMRAALEEAEKDFIADMESDGADFPENGTNHTDGAVTDSTNDTSQDNDTSSFHDRLPENENDGDVTIGAYHPEPSKPKDPPDGGGGGTVWHQGSGGIYLEGEYPPEKYIKAIRIWMIVSCVLLGCCTIGIGLAWTIPITVNIFKKIKTHEPISFNMKIVTLLFVSPIAGIMMIMRNDM